MPPMAAKLTDLEESWKILRPDYVHLKWEPPSEDSVRQWVRSLGEGGPGIFTLEGPSPTYRAQGCEVLLKLPIVIKSLKMWHQGVIDDLVSPAPVWRCLQDLVMVKHFVIEGHARKVADRGGWMAKLLRAIWEIRFLSDEGSPIDPFVRFLTDWVVHGRRPGTILRKLGLTKTLPRHLRLNAMAFLLALSKQNGAYGKVVFILDGLEVLAEGPSEQWRLRFQELVKVEATYAKFNAPVGLIIGYSKRKCGDLEEDPFYQKWCTPEHGRGV